MRRTTQSWMRASILVLVAVGFASSSHQDGEHKNLRGKQVTPSGIEEHRRDLNFMDIGGEETDNIFALRGDSFGITSEIEVDCTNGCGETGCPDTFKCTLVSGACFCLPEEIGSCVSSAAPVCGGSCDNEGDICVHLAEADICDCQLDPCFEKCESDCEPGTKCALNGDVCECVDTLAPSLAPSTTPTSSVEPSIEPSMSPGPSASSKPSVTPSHGPSLEPTISPGPSVSASNEPSVIISEMPSEAQTATDTSISSNIPTEVQTATDTSVASNMPTEVQTATDTSVASNMPTAEGSAFPSTADGSSMPTMDEGYSSSGVPTMEEGYSSSGVPTMDEGYSSGMPTMISTHFNTDFPSGSFEPSQEPSQSQSPSLSSQPSVAPTVTSEPSVSNMPSKEESMVPTQQDSTTSVEPTETNEPSQEPSQSQSPSFSIQPSVAPTVTSEPSVSNMPSKEESLIPTQTADSSEPSFEPTTTASPTFLPDNTKSRISGVFGDPHIVSFDDEEFDCNAEGEFIMLQSLNSSFMIQERFTDVSGDACAQTSVSTGFVINAEDLPKLQVSIPRSTTDDTAPVINGCPVNFFSAGAELKTPDPTLNAFGIILSIDESENEIIVRYPESDSGTRLVLTAGVRNTTAFGCFLSVKVYLPFDYLQNETLVGLLGQPDGDDENEWVDRNGNTLAQPANEQDRLFRAAYEYCTTNWCITNEDDSLFAYVGDENFQDLSGCNVTYDSELEQKVIEELAKEESILKSICGCDSDDDCEFSCLIDGICGGQEDAQNALEDADAIFELKDIFDPETPGPSSEPSDAPSSTPTESALPSSTPSISAAPSVSPAPSDSPAPSGAPSLSPEPSSVPSKVPSESPSSNPTAMPSGVPSQSPMPSSTPSISPKPTSSPAPTKSAAPSGVPSISVEPSTFPSNVPTTSPNTDPTSIPTDSGANPGDTPSPTLSPTDRTERERPTGDGGGLAPTTTEQRNRQYWRNVLRNIRRFARRRSRRQRRNRRGYRSRWRRRRWSFSRFRRSSRASSKRSSFWYDRFK